MRKVLFSRSFVFKRLSQQKPPSQFHVKNNFAWNSGNKWDYNRTDRIAFINNNFPAALQGTELFDLFIQSCKMQIAPISGLDK